jgi:hypothetical protein
LRQHAVHIITGAQLPWGGRHFPDISGLLVPDPDVMQSFALLTFDHGFDDVARELEGLADRARTARPGDRDALRSHDILGSFAGRIAKRKFEAPPSGGPILPDGVRALRGDNPELRPAIRSVLQDAAPDDEWIKRLGDVATALLPVPVVDLRPDALPLVSEPGARAAFVTLVEYVDRSRVMREFLQRAQELHPDPQRLDAVIRAFNRWDDAHESLLEAVGRAHR